MKGIRDQFHQPGAELTQAALGEIFDRYSDPIYNFCFRATGNWAEAEDLTSIVFLEAWRKRDRVDLTPDNAKPWLFGVAINVLRHRSRSRRRHAAAIKRLPIGETTPDFSEELAERMQYANRVAELRAAIDRIPRKQQEVVALCDWSELTVAEAADVLGVSEGTVKSRLSRARQALRGQLSTPGQRHEEEALR